ncbi:MAG TPA: RidA family protein [Candidatus Tumulicola sp.]|jgi:enamine deaminase RidA (YjgF/YER057c/UK114 family)
MSEAVNPAGWPRPSGYANGILAEGRFLAISGQIGWNERGELVSGDFLEQAGQALKNVVEVLRAAGGRPEDLVRLTWYVVDKQQYRAALRALGRTYREILGENYPAMTLVQVADLLEEGALVEVEATAILAQERSL